MIMPEKKATYFMNDIPVSNCSAGVSFVLGVDGDGNIITSTDENGEIVGIPDNGDCLFWRSTHLKVNGKELGCSENCQRIIKTETP